jgi:hypothetical protein
MGTVTGNVFASSSIGNLMTLDEIITAASFSSASGIGSGLCDSGESRVGNITIVNSDVNASGRPGIGSGIGRGNGQGLSRTSSVGILAILNGVISADSSRDGSGIGCGHAEDHGLSHIQRITVLNPHIDSCWPNQGSEIGGGDGQNRSNSSIESVVIFGGNANARTQYHGFEIGTGYRQCFCVFIDW